MEIAWLMGGFFIFVTLVFVAVAFFLPEWVGITGNRAREIMKEQQSPSDPTEPEPTSPPTSHS